jgi:hypothetical protein
MITHTPNSRAAEKEVVSMPKPTQCIVEGCPNESHAKGYCRRHYGQIWRRGTIYNDTPREQTSAPESGMRRDDRLKALERELKKAQQMYEVVVGFQGRIKWRREMEAVQYEIRKITEAEEQTDLPPIIAEESGVITGVVNDPVKENTL